MELPRRASARPAGGYAVLAGGRAPQKATPVARQAGPEVAEPAPQARAPAVGGPAPPPPRAATERPPGSAARGPAPAAAAEVPAANSDLEDVVAAPAAPAEGCSGAAPPAAHNELAAAAEAVLPPVETWGHDYLADWVAAQSGQQQQPAGAGATPGNGALGLDNESQLPGPDDAPPEGDSAGAASKGGAGTVARFRFPGAFGTGEADLALLNQVRWVRRARRAARSTSTLI